MTGHCADPYNPKTIRATMGAVFRQDIRHMSVPDLIKLKESGARFIGSAPGEGCCDITESDLRNSVIAIGSEGNGVSEDILSLCSLKIRIPTSPENDSLNAAAAAAIIMWEARRA
jgi:TrmH family RNA methyltransferase